MPKATRTPPHREKHAPSMCLPDGRSLNHGDQFSVKGEGRFIFFYVWGPDQSIACWGPVNNAGSQEAQWRAFPAERVTTIHRKKKESP